MSSKRNIIILVVVLALVIVGGIIGAVALSSGNAQADISETLSLAQRYLNEENYEQALIEFDRIIEIAPMNADAYLGKAEALIALGNTEEAKAVLEAAYELTGDADILAMLEELTKPEETAEVTTAAVTSVTETSAAEPIVEEEPSEPVWNDPYALGIEQMLLSYIRGEGELDTAVLADVTELVIYGTDIVYVSCGDRKGTEDRYKDQGGDFERQYFELIPQNERPKYDEYSNVINAVKYDYGTLSDISFMQYMTNAESITIMHDPISDITSLSNLKQLSVLKLFNNDISDITPLASLSALTELKISLNDISDISALASLSSLNALWLDFGNITDLSPLKGLTELEQLEFGYNDVSDLSPIAELTKLKVLYFPDNNVSDLSVLSGMTELNTLYFQNNPVSDITPIMGLTKLRNLGMKGTNVTDISAFEAAFPDCYIAQW